MADLKIIRILTCALLLMVTYGTCSEDFVDDLSYDVVDEPEIDTEQLDNTINKGSAAGSISAFGLASIADKVNSMKTTWTAGKNFHPQTSAAYLKNLAGTLNTVAESDFEKITGNCEDIDRLPKEFDPRKKWDYCPSLKTIYDQGNCGSCWAVAPATAFADRVCIQSKGAITTKLSMQALLSCCHVCYYKNGCQGGWPEGAWKFIQRHGLITGGTYNSNEGCQPYLMKPCSHHVENSTLPACKDPMEDAPSCKLRCYNSQYQTPWKKDLHKAKKLTQISPCRAMKELYYHGPITTRFKVHSDFYTYKSGVYQYTTGELVGAHAVRVIGWGEQDGIPYWLVANSWNESWGENGYFKIIRGVNELGFEDSFISGKP